MQRNRERLREVDRLTNDDETRGLRYEIVSRLQDLATESRHVAQSFSATQGLNHTDLEALLHVMRAEARGEAITSGGIADVLGLTSGAATGVIDRLARSGHVERRRDEHDRRVVRVHYSPEARLVAESFFGPLGEVTDRVMDEYTAGDLAMIATFLGRMNDAMARHARSVASPEESAPGRTVGG